MTTYKITIKDNSIPNTWAKKHNLITEYTAIINCKDNTELIQLINENIEWYAVELDTDPESLEILSIIKQ